MLENKINKQLCGTYYKYHCSIVRGAKNQSVVFFCGSVTYGVSSYKWFSSLADAGLEPSRYVLC